MSRDLRPRFPWWLPVIGIGLLGLFVWLVQNIRLPEIKVVNKKALPSLVVTTLNSTQANEAINEQSSLLDPTPLFLPTALNASQQGKPLSKRELGDAFDPFPARYQNRKAELELTLEWPRPVPKEPSAILALGETLNPLRGIAKEAAVPLLMTTRIGEMEVVDARTGQVCLQIEVSTNPNEEVHTQDWKPLEMLICIRDGGLVGMPVVIVSSGLNQVDQFFRRYAAGIFRLGHRIPPSTYNLRIGP